MKISVIIPVYNVERYIERCIQSVLNQTLQDFEIVIVNDASTDQSLEIIKKYSQNDKRFTVINNAQNMGLMWTRMVGYQNGNGKYFIFCDSDDFLPSNALKTLYEAITATGSTIVVGNAQRATDIDKKEILRNEFSFETNFESIYISLLTGKLSHCLWAKIYDRKLFDDFNYETFENQTNGEDGILFYQLVSNIESITQINDVVYYYYINTESATMSQITETKLQQIIFATDYISDYIELNNSPIMKYLVYRETRVLLALLNRHVSKNTIKNYSRSLDVDSLSTFRSVSRCYKGINLFINYALLSSALLRSIRSFLSQIDMHRLIKIN